MKQLFVYCLLFFSNIAFAQNDRPWEVVTHGDLDNVSQVGVFSEGLAAVKKNDKYGYIDKTGKLVIPYQFDFASKFSEGLALVEKNGEYGFIDRFVRFVIPCQFEDYPSEFSEGLAAVRKNDKYGYIDKTGKLVIPYQFDFAGSFSDGLANVKKEVSKEGIRRTYKTGFIDKTGSWVISYHDKPLGIDAFREGLVSSYGEDKHGYIDKTGRLVIPYQFESVFQFSEGLAAVNKNDKWGYIDKTGRLVIPYQFEDYPSEFSEGLAAVKKNDKWGYIDKMGRLVIPYQFAEATDFYGDYAFVTDKCQLKLGSIINKKGKIVHEFGCINDILDLVYSKEGIVAVKESNPRSDNPFYWYLWRLKPAKK